MFVRSALVLLSLISSLTFALPAPEHLLQKRTLPFGSILYKCTTPNHVALTFDDGPSRYTISNLDKLQAGGQRATFFLNADNYDNIYYHNATVRRIITDGHQIGSHT
jgi:peptidoglycan/xylan/chitin deacetylase (PgdA/CDA1 family)